VTLDQFIATGTDVADLSEVDPDAPEGTAGRIYLGCLWLEDTRTWKDDRNPGAGRWHTMIDRSEYRSDDIRVIEGVLYRFAQSEGMWYTFKHREG
jgi:hypothetical protein